ncbi:MAG: ABC transporter permease [Anaerolineaceae bacterium 4572_78]|nr:MAG: ABC transporter permease [Anaerolineaceae bacterium 4572_78]
MEEKSTFRTDQIMAIIQPFIVPVLAIFTSVIVGSIFLLAYGFNPIDAYSGLLDGAFGSNRRIAKTILNTIPYIFGGLAVAFAFKGGLFNIGAQGQLFMGAISAAYVGFVFEGLPFIIHMPLAVLAGALGGAFWGAIPGFLKAYTGAHEVITTIMFNYIALSFVGYLVSGPLKLEGSVIAKTPEIADAAKLPFFGTGELGLHYGIPLAILVAFIIYWLIWKTPFGFELRTVGLNPSAASYSGISVKRVTIFTMAISGLLAGLAGTVDTLGLIHHFEPSFNLGYGFDSITIALLAKNHPLGVILTSFLFGAMSAGSTRMQRASGVPSEIIQVVQALILMFVAAEQLIRIMYRLRSQEGEGLQLSSGWGAG